MSDFPPPGEPRPDPFGSGPQSPFEPPVGGSAPPPGSQQPGQPGYPPMPPGQGGYPPAGGYTTPGGAVAQYANFGQRLVALIIDSLITGAIFAILQLVTNSIVLDIFLSIASFAVGVAYFGHFHGTTGATIGKGMMGIKAVDQHTGQPIGFGRAVGRYLATILSALPCLLGFFWMLWDDKSQTWHDSLTGTVVVVDNSR